MKHLVLCAFVPGLDPSQIISDFAALEHSIDVVRSLEHGENVSHEGLDDGFTYCFTLEFDNAADRDAYLVDPEHLAFVERFGPTLEKVLVIDYEPQSSTGHTPPRA